MHQLIKRINYLWALLGLGYSTIVLGEKDLDLKEEEFHPHVEIPSAEFSRVQDVVDERELQSTMVRNKENQDFLFIKSDNLMDHLVSSGGTPFTQFDIVSITASASSLDTKSKEAFNRQKEWLNKLIEAYLQRFPK